MSNKVNAVNGLKVANLASQIKLIKSFLDLLNKEFKYEGGGIPSAIRDTMGGALVNVKVIPAPYFTAKFSEFLGKWWIYCTDYWIWSDETCSYYQKHLQEIAAEQGVGVNFCHVHVTRPEWEKEIAARNKEVFIGQVNSTIIR